MADEVVRDIPDKVWMALAEVLGYTHVAVPALKKHTDMARWMDAIVPALFEHWSSIRRSSVRDIPEEMVEKAAQVLLADYRSEHEGGEVSDFVPLARRALAEAFAGRPGAVELPDRETIARRFHDAYEKLAPAFGYRTREDSAKPWDDVPQANKALMVATAQHVRAWLSGVLSAALAGRQVVLLPNDAFDQIQDEIIRVGSGREANAVMALIKSWSAGSGSGED